MTGFLYTSARKSQAVTGQPIGTKRGIACATSVLGLFASGDASVVAAAQDAGITQIATVDVDTFAVLGIYASHCTIVTGE